jgi:hypothetical protein
MSGVGFILLHIAAAPLLCNEKVAEFSVFLSALVRQGQPANMAIWPSDFTGNVTGQFLSFLS